MSDMVLDTDGTDIAAVGAAFRRHTVAAARFDVTYYEAGEGEPLLCLPGAGGPHMRIALDLLAREHRVIVLELPGPRLAILGVVRTSLPTEEFALVRLQLAIAGVLDFPGRRFSLDASLYDSYV